MTQTQPCAHDVVSSTFKRGNYCCTCGEPLVGIFTPISRNTLRALLYALKKEWKQ